MNNILTMPGAEIKTLGAIKTSAGNFGKVGGTLCLYSTANDPDQTRARDFFSAKTDFDFVQGAKGPIYYHHGLDESVGIKRLGTATHELDSTGVIIPEGLISLDDPDGRKTYEGVESGELSWSSGTVSHLVRRTPVAAKSGEMSNHIDFWPIGLDASLTPLPAEPRAVAAAMKCLETALKMDINGMSQGEIDAQELADEIAYLRDELSYIYRQYAMSSERSYLMAQLARAQMDVLQLTM